MKTTQEERLIKYFKKTKTIDPIKAWTGLGIYRLSARILELRKKGYEIDTLKKAVKNRFGEDCVVAQYRMRGML